MALLSLHCFRQKCVILLSAGVLQAEERARARSSPMPGAADTPGLTAILELEAQRSSSAPASSLPAEALPPDGPPSGAFAESERGGGSACIALHMPHCCRPRHCN